MVDIADKIFPTLQIVSNGIIKIPERIRKKIFISIDGSKETHNEIRGVNCFDKVFENIKNDKRVVIACTLSASNFKQIEEIVKIAERAKVVGVTFSLYTAASQNDPLLLSGENLDYTINKLKEMKNRYEDFVLLSSMMIETFRTKEHVKTCFLRSKWVVSYYPNLKEKKPCVLGKNVACNTCGCIVPIVMHCIRQFDFEAARVAKKLYGASL